MIPYDGVDYISPYLIDNVTSVFEGLNCFQIRLNIQIGLSGFRQKSLFQVCFFGELRSDAEIIFLAIA
jgi:hypothetical protein